MSRKSRKFKTSHLKKTAPFRLLIVPVTGFVFKCFSRGMQAFPPALVYAVARGIGRLLWLASAKRRNTALRNLEIAFGDKYNIKERRRIARRSFQHFLMTIFDVFLLPRYKGNDWLAQVSMSQSQRELLDRIKSHPGPVAFHTGHMGSWEFSSGIAGWAGKPLTVVYRPLEFEPVDREIRRLRTSQGVKACAKKGAFRGYLKGLKNNEWLGVIADQNAGRSAAFVDFFGIPASTEASYFPLYQRFDTLACTFFAIREGNTFRFKVKGLYTTEVNRDADPVEESLRLAQWYMKCLEDTVREHPEQYNWLHNRWRSRPPEAPSIYKDLGKPLDPQILEQQPASPILPHKWQDAEDGNKTGRF